MSKKNRNVSSHTDNGNEACTHMGTRDTGAHTHTRPNRTETAAEAHTKQATSNEGKKAGKILDYTIHAH